MAKLLIVEDHNDAAEPLMAYLGKFGHAVDRAAHGASALTAVIDAPCDAIVLDLGLPIMDGVTFLQVLRSYLRLRTVPVVVWTALPLDGPDVSAARLFDVADVLPKARNGPAEVRAAIERALGEKVTA